MKSVLGIIALLLALFLAACTDYQAEFEESFGALEYVGEEIVSSDAGHHGGVSSSDESLPASSDEKTSKSSGSVDPSSATSSATPTSGGTEQPSSGAASSQSSGGQSSNSTGSSGSTESSSSTESNSSVKKDSCNVTYGNCFRDGRDGQTYKTTAEISGLVWMAENLNYEVNSSLCYDNSAENCAKYGRLYEIKSYYNSPDLCPDGWRMPDSVEWASLFARVGGPEMAGSVLKTKTGWDESDAISTDNINFSALPGGIAFSQNNFKGMFQNAYFMTSSKVAKNNNKYVVNLLYNENDVTFRDDYSESQFVSVRCVQGTLSSSSSVASSSSVKSSSSSAPPSSSSFGSSGRFEYVTGDKSYQLNYVTVNGLVWMDEDLRLRDKGTCYNDNYTCSAPYNLFTKSEAENACPQGWRLPTSDEFNNSNNLENWVTLNGDTKNVFLGYYLYKDWMEKDKGAMYWTKTKNGDTVDVIMVKYGYYYPKIVRVVQTEIDASLEFAIRCVRGELENSAPREPSSPSVTFALQPIRNQKGNVTTVRIGDMEWMAENLEDGLNLGGKCSNGNTSNCDAKGLFYTYEEALHVNNSPIRVPDIGDEHWRLPRRADIVKLNKLVGSDHYKGLLSFEMGGTNEFGFNVIPSGYYNENGVYNSFYEEACFWLFTEDVSSGRADAACFKKGDSVDSVKVTTLLKNERHPVRFLWTETF